jgi:deaminated glutathione amidase
MKVAVIQIQSSADKNANIQRAIKLTLQAVGNKAKLICLPEVFHYRGKTTKNFLWRRVAEIIPGESLRPLQDIARGHRVFILAGSIFEKGESGKIFNTAIFIDCRGKIRAKYRKMNLFDAAIGGRVANESQVFFRGKTPAVARAGDFKMGLSICFDLRFPELYRYYAKAGCDVLIIPSAFTRETGQAHWETLLRARAIENQAYVLAPNQIGKDAKGVTAYGNSMIIGPWGEILSCAGQAKEGVIYSELKREEIQRVRKAIPLPHTKESNLRK